MAFNKKSNRQKNVEILELRQKLKNTAQQKKEINLLHVASERTIDNLTIQWELLDYELKEIKSTRCYKIGNYFKRKWEKLILHPKFLTLFNFKEDTLTSRMANKKRNE